LAAPERKHDAMGSQLISIGAILLSAAFLLVANGLVGTLTPLRAQLDGFSGLAIGAMGSFNYAGFVLGCFLGPRLIARVGHIRTFAVGAALTAATVLLQAIYTEPVVWFAVRAAFGLCAAGVIMALESWLNDRATNQTRGRLLAAYVIVNLGCLMLGQWLLLAASPQGFELFSLAAIVYICCIVPVGLTRLPQPVPPVVPTLRVARLVRSAPVGMAGVITVGLANGAVWALAPVYAHSRGYSTFGVALFMSAFILGGTLVQWPLGRYSDSVDRRWIIAAVCAAASVSGLALALVGRGGAVPPLLFPFLFGAATLPLYALSVAHSNDRMHASDFVEASASLLLMNGVASVAGPLLAAFVMAHAGMSALFFYTAGVELLMALFTVWRIARVESVPEEQREPFVPMPQQASPQAIDLDPRAPEVADPPAA
jgi:MFS family permease